MVTILDAHPEIAMSYELYPNLLVSQNDKTIDPAELSEILAHSKNDEQVVKRIKDKNLRTFVSRCLRGGVNYKHLIQLLQDHIQAGGHFADIENRLRFIERCCRQKMHTQNKLRWGLKCSNRFDDYLAVWPGAFFLNMIRDGRDVLASQLNTGSFTNSPEEVGKGWANTHLRFRELVERSGVNAYEVYYEKLVQEPELEIRKICDFLNIQFHRSMLNFYQQDLTIYKATHLSMDRISKPIDASKIGRWKKEVSQDQLERFYTTAGEAMITFHYLETNEWSQTQ
jgi:hypothetical protein